MIKEDGCVDSGYIIQPVRHGPWSGRILGSDDIVAFISEVSIDHVKCAVMIPKGRRHYTVNHAGVFYVKSIFRRHGIADLFPVSQILAVKDRKTGAQFKAGAGQIKIITDTADGRIRIKPGNDRVNQLVRHRRDSFHFVIILILT